MMTGLFSLTLAWTSLGMSIASAEQSIFLRGNFTQVNIKEKEVQQQCDETNSCLLGAGQTMHSTGWNKQCTEMCVPSWIRGLKSWLNWECGPCPPSVKALGSTSEYSKNNKLKLWRPHSSEGDLMLLFLSRTDDLLPLEIDGWTTGPTCFKSDNVQMTCHTVKDCKERNGSYCEAFGKDPEDNGLDLATGVYYKTVQPGEPISYNFKLLCSSFKCHPTWGILTAVRGADNEDPLGDTATESYDEFNGSRFASVKGSPGDLLLLSMAFDDGKTTQVTEASFRAPDGMQRLQYVIGDDEAGFLYAEDLKFSGDVGMRTTTGAGDQVDKDAMISLVVRKRQS